MNVAHPMAAAINLQPLLAMLFSGGLVGMLTVVVTSYRRVKTGKLSDDESIIKRIHRELDRADKRADEAETDRDSQSRLRRFWEDQASIYRRQLLAAGMTPQDLEM